MAGPLMALRQRYGPDWVHFFLIFASVAGIGAAHYIIPHTLVLWHNFAQWVYYLPVLYAAIRFGVWPALAAAALASAGYVPHLLAPPEGYPNDFVAVQYAAIFMLLGVGAVTGVLADRERKRRAELQKALDELSRSHQRLKVLAGGIAHNFNNLLTAIIGNAEMAARALPPSSLARAQIEAMRRAGERAAELTRQMLVYSGPGRFFLSLVDLTEVIGARTDLIQASIPPRIRLRFELARDLPVIRADVGQLEHLVVDLVANGVEAVGESSGTVAVRTGVRDIDEQFAREHAAGDDLPSGRYVFLEVQDTGCGIDEGIKSKIFDPFFSTKFMGRGMGLAAALGIARGHKGTIRVESSSGGGSTFTVLLPAALADQSREAA